MRATISRIARVLHDGIVRPDGVHETISNALPWAVSGFLILYASGCVFLIMEPLP